MNNEALLTAITEMMVMQFRELEEGLETKFEKMLDEKLAPIYERLDRLEARMDAIETRMDAIESRMDAIEARMDAIESRMDAIESDMKDVKKRLANIEGAFYEEFHPLLVTHAIPRLSSVERKLEDEVIPQLNHTRNFAEATYKLATTAMDWLSTMQADIDALKITVQQHSKLLA
ncbi:MAG: hypothetical protein IKU09_09215 [Firmicutes bacterium]|nr:hypothetical protein [Bacillota bacterium]